VNYITVTFSDEEIQKVKKIRAEEANLPGRQIFDSDHRWVGKLGEWAVRTVFPLWEEITSHFSAQQVDFRDLEGRLVEVKTKCSKYPFRDSYDFDVNDLQLKKNHNDIYVACYHELGTSEVLVVGWLPKEELLERGELLHKGDLYHGRYVVRADRWSLAFREFRPIHLLLSKKIRA